MYVPHFVYLPVNGHLGSFHLFGIVNNAALDIDVHISVLVFVLNYFGYVPKSGISGSYCNSF